MESTEKPIAICNLVQYSGPYALPWVLTAVIVTIDNKSTRSHSLGRLYIGFQDELLPSLAFLAELG